MVQSADQLLRWTLAALPALECRIARTAAAIAHSRKLLGSME
ncbi:hypothetical protein [Sphingomonas sp.]|jgi:hypothetical protein